MASYHDRAAEHARKSLLTLLEAETNVDHGTSTYKIWWIYINSKVSDLCNVQLRESKMKMEIWPFLHPTC